MKRCSKCKKEYLQKALEYLKKHDTTVVPFSAGDVE